MRFTVTVIFLICSLIVSGQERFDDRVSIDEPVNDDLYLAGGTVTINAPVYGDVLICGGTVVVNDSISEDLIVAGGNVTVNGFIGDDVRIAAGSVEINNNVKGDVLAAGGELTLKSSMVVYGDVMMTGGRISIDGTVNGDIEAASGTFTLNGNAEKDLECHAGNININGIVNGTSVLAANTIAIGNKAKFKDEVRFWNSEGSLDFKNSLSGGGAIFDSSLQMEEGKWHYLGFASLPMVIWFLGTALLMIAVIQLLFSHSFSNAADIIKRSSLRSLGLGLLFLVGVPIGIILSMITIVGIPVGVIMLISFALILMLATIIVSVLISNWINNTYYHSSWGNGRIVLTAFGIFICLKLASLTPVIGPLIMFLLVCMGFGGLLQNIRWRKAKELSMVS